jgi:hypothetical protein
MFSISINNVRGTIAGCPESGLAAVDFRRACGLSDQPHDRIPALDPMAIYDETICRAFADRLDASADLVVTRDGFVYPPALLVRMLEATSRANWKSNLDAQHRAAVVEFLAYHFAECDRLDAAKRLDVVA